MDAIGFRRLMLVAALSAATVTLPAAQAVRGSTAPRLPKEKQAFKERTDRLRADALSAPRPLKDPSFRPVPDAVEPSWLDGIIESGLAPYPGGLYEFVNQWQSIVGSEHVNVYAGADRQNPAQGLVAVDYTPVTLEGTASPGGVYMTPSATGAVRIISAAAAVLTLESSGGARYAFDLTTRVFTML